MKKSLVTLILIIGNSFLYLGCEDCSDSSTPDYYFRLTNLGADHYNPNDKDTVTYAEYGLVITPETETRYSAIGSSRGLSISAGKLYACDPYIGRFYGYDPAINSIDVIAQSTFNGNFGSGDTISSIFYRELYGSRQYLTEVNTFEIPENFFDEPLILSESPIDSIPQQFTVVLQLSDGTDLTATTELLFIQ